MAGGAVRRSGLAVLAVLGMAALAVPASAAPKAELWPRWTAHDPASTRAVDHAAWDAFLARYVAPGPDGVNRVAYRAVTADDRRLLSGYIARLAATPVGALRRDEQRAFWINLYNALTVRVVLDHYPVKSILDIRISPGLFAPGPWGRKLATVDGIALSLDDIEHRILRPIWRDPRIHYAVNCASLGCPNLQRRAFTAANAEAMLDDGARAYVNDARGAAFDGEALFVSSIYKWFEADFGGSTAGVLAHLKSYAAPALKARLEAVPDIAGYAYDWSLNDAAPSP